MGVAIWPEDLGEFETRLAAADQVLAESRVDGSPELRYRVADALLVKAAGLRDLFYRRRALACAVEVIARFGDTSDPLLQRRVISAQSVRATLLPALGTAEEALPVAEWLAARAAGQADEELRWCLASALMTQAGALMMVGRPVEARQTAERLSREFAADPWQGPRRANMVGVGLYMQAEAAIAQGKRSDAEGLLEEVVERFMSEREPSTRALIVRATALTAQLMSDEGCVEEALDLRQDMLDAYANATRPGLRNVISGLAITQAVALRDLDRVEAALTVLDRMLEGLVSLPDPRVHPTYELRGAALKARCLSQLKRRDDAIVACDTALMHYEQAPPPDVENELSELLQLKATLLEELGHVTDAMGVLDETLDRFEEESLRPGPVAGALMQRALLLERANRPADALSACRDIVARFGERPPPDTPWIVLDALYRVPALLDTLGHRRKAIAACEEVVERFGAEDDLNARHAVSEILSYKARLLLSRGRTRQALKTLESVLRYTKGSTARELDQLANQARESHSAIRTRRDDRRRLTIATLTPLAVLAGLAGLGWKIINSLLAGRRRPDR